MLQTTAPWTNYRVPDSLADDTEERVVGTEWQQEAIGDLAGKLREAGRRQNATWGVCEQVALAGLHHTDGRAYDPRPDVFVLSHPLPSGGISAIALDDAGAPLFIAEIASRSTMGDDVGEKRQVYEAIGVQEYLVFDPDGTLLSTPLLGWRLDGIHFVPWRPGSDGFWHSSTLQIVLRPLPPFLEIYDLRGDEIPSLRDLHTQLEQERRLRTEEHRQRLALEEELRRFRTNL